MTDPDGVHTMEFEEAEHVLAQSADHRVLRRLPPIAEWKLTAAEGPTRRALFVDIKTTGPSSNIDQVMELGSIVFDYDLASGAVVRIDAPWAFEDPEPEAIDALARGVDLVIAHDAAFVRPMLEKLSPAFLEMNWASLLDEVGWADEGFALVRVDDLLMRLGWFNPSMDARSHALAGAFLMTQTLPRSGRLVLSALLAHARRPLMAVRADGTAFEKRDQLKERGYRWDADPINPAWWILTDYPQVEIAWLHAVIYQHAREITPIPMPATRRYSSRLWCGGEDP